MLAVAHSLAMLFAARIVDGLSGGNITTARAYIADITHRGEPRQVVRHARRRLRPRLHRRAGAGRAVLAHQLHRADLGGRGDHRRRDGAGVGLAAGDRAPRARRRRSPWAALRELGGRESLRAPVHRRLRLLDGVRRLPDDVRAVRGAAVRLRRRAYRLPVERVRVPRRAGPGRAGRAGGRAVRRQARRWRIGPAVRGGRLGRQRADPLAAGVRR